MKNPKGGEGGGMLREYVNEHVRCFDAPKNPELHQPSGHTADLMFFKVALKGSATKETFLSKVVAEYPHWLDGKEHGYLEIGANVGDQGLALMTMGMGKVLGVWDLLTPNLLGDLIDVATKKEMAGKGMITIKSSKQ